MLLVGLFLTAMGGGGWDEYGDGGRKKKSSKLVVFTCRRQSWIGRHSRKIESLSKDRVKLMATAKDDRIEMLERRVCQLELVLESHLDSLRHRSMEELFWRRQLQLEHYKQEYYKREHERLPIRPDDEDEIDRV